VSEEELAEVREAMLEQREEIRGYLSERGVDVDTGSDTDE
jgi:hypothetical protein